MNHRPSARFNLRALPSVPIPTLFAQHAIAIDHIAVAVRNLDDSIEWCTMLFGCELVDRRRTDGEYTSMYSAVLKLGGITVVLTQGGCAESQVSRYLDHYGPGVTHVAIEVRNLAAITEELREAGVVFATDIIACEGLQQIFTKRDPGTGLMFELIERKGGHFSEESVNTLYRTLEANGDF